MRDILIKAYLEWKNDWLTISGFAEHHGLTDQQAYDLISLARSVFESEHPEA